MRHHRDYTPGHSSGGALAGRAVRADAAAVGERFDTWCKEQIKPWVDDHVHIHLVCDRCGKVDSIDAMIADPFLDELRRRTGFVTDVSHVALHGTCSDCSTAST